MWEDTMVRQAAPTLAGIKAANLYPYTAAADEHLEEALARWNEAFASKGIRTVVLGHCLARPSQVLLYTYRPALLGRILQQDDVRAFLLGYGYGSSFSMEECLALLASRLCPQQPFPHEVGVFLGYPLADVVGFIRNRGSNYLCSGLWKVYADKERTLKLFRQFDRCTRAYCRWYAGGKTITQLTAAV